MFSIITRVLFIVFCVILGAYFFSGSNTPITPELVGGFFGLCWATAILLLEWGLKNTPPKGLIAGSIGLISGLILGNLVAGTVLRFPFDVRISLILRVGIALAFGYLGMMVAWRKREEFRIFLPQLAKIGEKKRKLLDTSVIIDGRIADIAETGFMEGVIVIPQFILNELHKIADSPTPLRRKKGRRGLDILNKMRKGGALEVVIEEKDFPEIKEVDSKLIHLARAINGIIVTNDYNLNKIAKLQEVSVLNINDLTKALKPVILPSEELEVKVVKEGKEHNQGIAYLDDGTMVVIEDGKELIGKEIRAEVTSILQTSAGRMIFAKQKNNKKARRES